MNPVRLEVAPQIAQAIVDEIDGMAQPSAYLRALATEFRSQLMPKRRTASTPFPRHILATKAPNDQ